MARKRLRLHPITQVFLATVGLTLAVWFLRGIALLAFIPGLVLWILILASISLGIVSSLQRIR